MTSLSFDAAIFSDTPTLDPDSTRVRAVHRIEDM